MKHDWITILKTLVLAFYTALALIMAAWLTMEANKPVVMLLALTIVFIFIYLVLED